MLVLICYNTNISFDNIDIWIDFLTQACCSVRVTNLDVSKMTVEGMTLLLYLFGLLHSPSVFHTVMVFLH